MSITDWDKRLLCADGGCVGLIGPDGTCKVCGRVAPNWGDERRRGLKTTGEVAKPADAEPAAAGDDEDADLDAAEDAGIDGEDDEGEEDDDYDEDDDDEDDDEDGDDGESDDDGIVQASAKGSGEWAERELCANGACIGVIGDDGRCRTCGKTAEKPGAAAAADAADEAGDA